MRNLLHELRADALEATLTAASLGVFFKFILVMAGWAEAAALPPV